VPSAPSLLNTSRIGLSEGCRSTAVTRVASRMSRFTSSASAWTIDPSPCSTIASGVDGSFPKPPVASEAGVTHRRMYQAGIDSRPIPCMTKNW
jgi:hypothetical protein